MLIHTAAHLGRSYGWAADHVHALDVVTVDGDLRRASPDTDVDLYWGLRGARGNLGVVTAIEISLFSLRHVHGGGVFLPGQAAADALHTWRTFTATAPDEMQSAFALVRFPADPALPTEIQGRFLIHLRVAYNGPGAEGDRLLEPMRRVATPVLDHGTAGLHRDRAHQPRPDRARLLRRALRTARRAGGGHHRRHRRRARARQRDV